MTEKNKQELSFTEGPVFGALIRFALPVSFSKGQCKIYPQELKRILNVGIPIALQEAMVQISFLVVNSIINDMGLMQSAGYGVAQKLISFIMLVPSSIMQSVSAFVAQNIGAGKKERAKKGFFTAIITGCTAGIVIFFAGFFGGAISDAGGSGNTDHYGIWDHLLYDLFRMAEAKR